VRKIFPYSLFYHLSLSAPPSRSVRVCESCVCVCVCCVWGGSPTIMKVHFNCRKPLSGSPLRTCVCVCYQSLEILPEGRDIFYFLKHPRGRGPYFCVAAAASVFDVFQPISISFCPAAYVCVCSRAEKRNCICICRIVRSPQWFVWLCARVYLIFEWAHPLCCVFLC